MARFASAALVSGLLWAGPAGAADIDRDALHRAVEATVFVKTERAFQHERFPASGSGFFISDRGHVLTNWHVIADQFEGFLWGREREISAKVLHLWVVVDSGTPQEREIPATVLARDRKLDLALLKVPYRPKAYLDVGHLAELHLADPIWIVGFPYGSLMAALKEPGKMDPQANPEVSIASGMVTSFRRDATGKLAGVQIDAPVNPGNSGGPMLTADGALAGVVFAKFSQGEGLGLAVPPENIRRFVERQLVRIRFKPGAVLEPPSPITVTVEPILARIEATSGSVRLSGDDIPETSVPLTASGSRLTATIPFPQRIEGVPLPKSYLAVVTLRNSGGGVVLRRRYRLDCVQAAVRKLRSERDPSHMMEDRRVLGNEMEIRDYAESRTGSDKASSLAAVARKLKLKKNENGSVVIDDHTVRRITSYTPDPANYAQLPEGDLRKLAEEFDTTLHRLRSVRSRIKELKEAKPVTHNIYGTFVYYTIPWSNERMSEEQKRKLLSQLKHEERRLQRTLRTITTDVHAHGLCRCQDDRWYLMRLSPCGCPVLPTR